MGARYVTLDSHSARQAVSAIVSQVNTQISREADGWSTRDTHLAQTWMMADLW